MNPDDKVDPTPVYELIETMRLEAVEAGFGVADPRAGWWFRLTGETIHGTAWESRILRARKTGWIRREHRDRIIALGERRAPLGRRPRSERDPVPRISSEPLRGFYRGEAEMISVYEADWVCVKQMGLHPSLVYGDDWWDVA